MRRPGPAKSTRRNAPIARIHVFAFDLSEASQIRRIRALRKLGHEVSTAGFRRANMNVDFVPDWDNTDLGVVENQKLASRAWKMIVGFFRVLRAPDPIRRADVIIARNFDLLLIAWASRLALGARRIPLVYECLDIHGIFTGSGSKSRIFRWLERRLLGRIQLLIVSSPGFVTHYFHAIQRYDGPVSILENKLWFETETLPRPEARPRRAADAPLVLGWVGSIRCQPSLDLLLETAARMGPDLRLAIHGNVHAHALSDFDAAITGKSNVSYHGPYRYPDDLEGIYAGCDLVWAQDLWQSGANSDWLLPNRIYEASWFGCPSVAVATTETGRRVAAGELGITIADATADSLTGALTSITDAELSALSSGLLAQPDGAFRLYPKDLEDALRPVLPAVSV